MATSRSKTFLRVAAFAGSGLSDLSCKRTRRRNHSFHFRGRDFGRGHVSQQCSSEEVEVCESPNERGEGVYLAGGQAVQPAVWGCAQGGELREHVPSLAGRPSRRAVSVPLEYVENNPVQKQEPVYGAMEREGCNVGMVRRQARRVGLSVALLGTLLVMLPHSAFGLTLDSSRPKFDAWLRASEMPTPDVSVHMEWNLDVCPTASACVTTSRDVEGRPVFAMYVDDGGPVKTSQEAFYHEIGHVFDGALLTDADRVEFRRLMRDWREWSWGGAQSPLERFANAYAWCALNGPGEWADRRFKEYQVGPKTHKRICAFMLRILSPDKGAVK